MRSVNKVILVGNIPRDPEMRQTSSGQHVTTFGIATNRQWVTKDTDKHSLAEYHEIVAWAKLAEICNQYLRKGKLVYVEGYLKTRSWDTPEGIKKFKTEVVIQDMIMLEKRPKDDNGEFIPEAETSEQNDTPALETEKPTPEAPAKKEIKEEPTEVVKEKTPVEEEKKEEKKTTEPGEIDIDKDLGL